MTDGQSKKKNLIWRLKKEGVKKGERRKGEEGREGRKELEGEVWVKAGVEGRDVKEGRGKRKSLKEWSVGGESKEE